MKIEGEFTIYTAAFWKEQLLKEVATAPAIDLDLSAVNEFDSAGLQLLMLARRESDALGKVMNLRAPSRCVVDALHLCRLTEHFTIFPTVACQPGEPA